MRSKDYFSNYLGLKDRYDEYFQAGLLVIDLERYSNLNIHTIAREELAKNVFWFVDQDLLNKYFLGDVKFLDTSWNCLNTIMNSKNLVGSFWASKIAEDFENPKIVHYAGYEAKPWINTNVAWSEVYWYFLRKTFWYESVFDFRVNNKKKDSLRFGVDFAGYAYELIRRIWVVMPYYVKYILMPFKSVLGKRR
jgi:lipopolysaccharide biosynthesis glycosyltransferase